MTTLGKELQNTIRNIETIVNSQRLPSDEILAILDTLYEQQIELIDAAIQNKTEEYKKVTKSMQEAATKTKEAVDDLGRLEKSIEKVAKAIGKITKLLSNVA